MFKLPQFNIKSELELSKLLSSASGKEFKGMLNSCYKPKIITYKNDFIALTGLTDKIMDEFKNTLEYKSIKTFTDKTTLMLMVLIVHFCKAHKFKMSEQLYIYLGIRFYSNVINTYLERHCNPEMFESALNNLSIKHLFKQRGGIANTVLYLSTMEFEKRKFILANPNLIEKQVVEACYALRHRINQSMHSFANIYFDILNNKDKGRIRTQDEESAKEEVRDINYVADTISRDMCTYSSIDKNSLQKAITISGLRPDLAKNTIEYVSSIDNRETIIFLVILLNRIDGLKTMCQEGARVKYIRKIISDKAVYGHYSIKEEMKSLLYGLENNYDLRLVNQNVLITFFATYLTLYIKNKIC